MFTNVHLQNNNTKDVYNNTFVNTIKIYRLRIELDTIRRGQKQGDKKLSTI